MDPDPKATPCEIRPARAGDAAALAGLVTQLGYPVEAEPMAARLERLDAAGLETLVAVAGRSEDPGEGEVVGLVGFQIETSYTRDHPVGRLAVIAVDAERRGQGIGRQLVEAVHRALIGRGVGEVRLTSRLDREAAHRFWEGCGYRRTGVRFGRSLGA